MLTGGLAFCLVAIVTSRPWLIVRGLMTQLRLPTDATCITVTEFAKKKIVFDAFVLTKVSTKYYFVVFWLENILFRWQVWRGLLYIILVI